MNTKKYVTLDEALEVLDRQSCYWAAEYMKLIPAADVVPVVRGEWIYTPTEPLGYVCSVCGKGFCRCNYCPNCGADLRSEIQPSFGFPDERKEQT